MLEEIRSNFKVTTIDLSKDEQFDPDFKKISPFSKIPVIIDHEKNISMFESGAILIYLAEKYNKFYDLNNRNVINQWLMAQMGTVGPMIGQHHQFHHYNPGKSDFGEKRFFKITERIYKDYGLLFFEKGLLPDTIDHYELNKFTISNRIFSFLIKAKNVEKKKNLQKPRYFDTNRYRNNNNNNNNKNEFVFNEDDFPTL